MKCPKCKIEMVEGQLLDNGMSWYVKLGKFTQALIRLGRRSLVIAWKCPNCKKLELEVE